jgi:hypothetical protein
MWEKQ